MLGKKIKVLREENGLKQKDVANALKVSPQAVSLWETDGADPDIINIKKLAVFFNVTTDELLDFKVEL